MAREKPQQEEGGSNWMDTYGDMVTLLLTFFVLLFAFSSMDDSKWEALVTAFTGSPPLRSIAAIDLIDEPDFTEFLPQTQLNLRDMRSGGQTQAETPELSFEMGELTPEQIEQLQLALSQEQIEIMGTEEYKQNEKDFSELYEKLVEYIEVNGLEEMLEVDRDLESIYLRVAAGVLFQSGRADIRAEAMPILDTLEDIFFAAGDTLSMVDVEGHTDTVPISTARFPSNWELSAARATEVGRYVWEKGRIPQEKFSVSGYGEFRPVASNDTEEGKQANRRVEFVLRKRELTRADIEARDEEGEPPTVDVSQDPTQAAEAMPGGSMDPTEGYTGPQDPAAAA